MSRAFKNNIIFVLLEMLLIIAGLYFNNTFLYLLCICVQALHLGIQVFSMIKVMYGFKNRDLEAIGSAFPLVQELMEKTRIDPITGCNRRTDFENVRGKYEKRDSIVIGFFDVNGLKRVNDEQGHEAGDKLLKAAGQKILELTRYGDVYRWGGDEFIFISNEEKNLVYQRLTSWYKSICDNPDLSIAMGIAHRTNVKNYSIEDLVKEADNNMYENKKKHKKTEQK